MTPHQDMDEAFEQGRQLLDEERYTEAIDLYETIARDHPDHPRALFHLAGAYDAAGEEEKAVAPYRAAIAGGLDEEESLRASIQLASTLRNLEEDDEAVSILARVCAERPDHRAARAFFALALVNAGDAKRGVAELLDSMLTNPGPFEAYNRSLRWYADDLVGKAD